MSCIKLTILAVTAAALLACGPQQAQATSFTNDRDLLEDGGLLDNDDNDFIYENNEDEIFTDEAAEMFDDNLPTGKSWIRLSGVVTNIFNETITLDTGSNDVKVDVDDLDIDDLGGLIDKGDRITVIGEIDDDNLGDDIEAWRIYAMTNAGTIFIRR